MAAAVGRSAAWRAEQQLHDLQDLVQRQTAAREALHVAVFDRDQVGVRAALAPGACFLLLAVEAQWAQRELKAICDEDEEKRLREETRQGIAEAIEQSCSASLAKYIQQARSIGLPSQEICSAELELMGIRKKDQRRKAEEAACAEVDKAVQDGDVQALLAVLSRVEGIIPAEKVSAAQRKIPGMQARAEMRSLLSTAMRNPGDLQGLRHAVFAAKRSTLPTAEIAAAQEALKQAELAKKKQVKEAALAACRAVPSVQAAPAAATAPAPEVAAATQTSPVASPSRRLSALEQAVRFKDKELIQAAIGDLKASGLSAREVHSLQMRAVAEFGGGG